jgi:hypothetical protein
MISSAEACRLVQQQLPEISRESPPESDIYAALSLMREYACRKVQEHDFPRLQQCLSTAGALYEKGSQPVRSAVENIVVYSLSRLFIIAPEAKQQIKAALPRSLQDLYINQVLDHGY